jgi:hypothetical protein
MGTAFGAEKLMRPVTINTNDVAGALIELMRASHENDIVDLAQNFKPDVAGFTPTYTIDTTTPSAANIANFLATLITVMQRGAINRTT